MSQRILVAVGSKYGATFEIGTHIGHRFDERGLQASVQEAADVETITGYTGVVLGSAVYGGKWLTDATRLAERIAVADSPPKVWLFSSGLTGDPSDPRAAAEGLDRLAEKVAARDVCLFRGKLDKSQLNLAEKAMMMAVRAPDGDYRDWDEVSKWADNIAAEVISYSPNTDTWSVEGRAGR